MKLRKISGLSWEDLARLLEVDSQTLYRFASGKPMESEKQAHLLRVLDVLEKVDQGCAAKNRSMLLDEKEGVVLLNLLAKKDYASFLDATGPGPGRCKKSPGPLSPEEIEARKPRPPGELVGALHDPVHS